MKKLSLLLTCLWFFNLAGAQDKVPSFSKIDRADLEMKDCDFDPGAEVLVLIDFGEIAFSFVQNVGWVSESYYRVRIKVLKEKGVNRAQIKLRYRSKDRLEEISAVKGISFNLGTDGKIEESELGNKSVYEKLINKEVTEISFALPNVKVGTVFEYKYKLYRKSYSHIPDWSFQRSIPVRYSAYNVIVPEYFQFTTQAIARQSMERETKNSDKGSWYIMHNIPGLKEEPYSSGRNSYLQRIEFQLSQINAPNYFENIRTTWPKIIEELLEAEVFGKAYKKNIKGTVELDGLLKHGLENKEKIRLIYNYVQRTMQWNEDYGFFTYDNIKEAWDKKNGSQAEINFILISLLKDAGIDARPLLISTKDNGTVNTVFPFVNQFNGVLVYVIDGNDTYILNAADKYNPFNLIPYDVLLTNALVVDKKDGGLVVLEADGKFNNNIFFTCAVESDGKLSGQATINSSGYARNVRMEASKKNRVKEIFEDNGSITIKVDSVSLNNEKDELLPLEQKAAFTGVVEKAGEYYLLPFNLFMGLGKNLFISDDRVMDIDFYYPRSYLITGTYYLPEDFAVSELPKNTKMIMPDTSIVLSRMMQLSGNILSFRFSLDIKAAGYTAEGYPYIKEFFKKMYAIMDERIVMKKK